MHIHCNATTNRRMRQAIGDSTGTLRQIAEQFKVSVSTVRRWRSRNEVEDRKSTPKRIAYNLAPEEEALALGLRTRGLSLDDVFESLMLVLTHLRRSSLHRLFVREGVSRLKPTPRKAHGLFKPYPPGYVHIDLFYLPALGGQARYCFVAIDRATRMVLLRVKDRKTAQCAQEFLQECLEFFPFRIDKILTDNGTEFTNKTWGRHQSGAKKTHPFDAICQANGIEHRLTKPYTPKTNGLVERTNGLAKTATVKAKTYTSHQDLEQDIIQWQTYYNTTRKHRKLGYLTPLEKALEWYNTNPELFNRCPMDQPEAKCA